MQARKHKRLQAEERASPAKSADNVTEKIAWATSGHTLTTKKKKREDAIGSKSNETWASTALTDSGKT